jgi:hypothetical protein
MEDVVASLFERVDELERTIMRKDATIKVLNEQLNAKQPRQEGSSLEPLPVLQHQGSSRMAIQTDNMHFVSSLTGEEITLSFPQSASSAAVPNLSRQQTIRTHFAELFGETRQFFDAKDKLKKDLEAKVAQLEEEHRTRIEFVTFQYQ